MGVYKIGAKAYMKQYRSKRWFGGQYEAVMERDKHCCVMCRRIERLHIHHKDRNRENNELGNLETLCWWCHGKVHSTSIPIGRYSLEGKLLDTYNGMREASRITGVEYSRIAKCCRNRPKAKTAGGFVWRVL
jgi:hypothetical protein